MKKREMKKAGIPGRKRQLLAVFAAAILSAGCLPGMTVNICADSVNEYYEDSTAIKTAKELMNMKSDGTYHLAGDIDLSGVKWHSIRNFKGTFDGNGYEIKNLTSSTYGLFSSVGSNAVIKNVKLTNADIKSRYKTVGAVVSVINEKVQNVEIDNCFVSGVVASCLKKYGKSSSSSTAGAIVGKNSSESSVISDCYSNAVVCAERQVGGIVGSNKGSVINSGFGGTIENSRNIYELVADDNGEMDDSYSYLYYYGGICGVNYGRVESCFSNYTDMACGKYAGGIVGAAMKNSKITGCLNLTKMCLNDGMYPGLISGYASKKSEITNTCSREPNNSMTVDIVGKTAGKFKVSVIPLDKLGNKESIKVLGDKWSIENETPVLVSIKDYISLEKTFTIKGGRLTA